MGKKSGQVRETEQQRALADVANKQLADYRARWLPVQRKLAEGVKRDGAQGSDARKIAAGKASTDSAVRFGEAKGAVESALTESGLSLIHI